MSKHTPAPWAAFTDDSGTSPHTNIMAFAPGTDCVFSLPGHHKNEANVRLIVAAPDMLAALKTALPRLEDNARFLRDIQAHSSQVVPAFDAVAAVKSVIAKAEGGAA